MSWGIILALYGSPLLLVVGGGLLTWRSRIVMRAAWDQARADAARHAGAGEDAEAPAKQARSSRRKQRLIERDDVVA